MQLSVKTPFSSNRLTNSNRNEWSFHSCYLPVLVCCLKKRCFHRKCAHVLHCLIKISILFILLCVLNMFHNPSTSTQLSKVPSNDVQIVSGLLFFPFTQSKKSSKDIQIVSLFFIYLHNQGFFFSNDTSV